MTLCSALDCKKTGVHVFPKDIKRRKQWIKALRRKNWEPTKYSSAMRERKSLFIFLMGLAWKFRFSMPLLLSTSVAMLGRAWMFQIRVQTVQGLHENEMAFYDDEEEDESTSWETESTDSWETLVTEEAYG